jgi:hypothetical protein
MNSAERLMAAGRASAGRGKPHIIRIGDAWAACYSETWGNGAFVLTPTVRWGLTPWLAGQLLRIPLTFARTNAAMDRLLAGRG